MMAASDKIMLMLTGTICWVVISVSFVPMITGNQLSETKAKMMAAIVTSMISIISMYIGAKIQQTKGETLRFNRPKVKIKKDE